MYKKNHGIERVSGGYITEKKTIRKLTIINYSLFYRLLHRSYTKGEIKLEKLSFDVSKMSVIQLSLEKRAADFFLKI